MNNIAIPAVVENRFKFQDLSNDSLLNKLIDGCKKNKLRSQELLYKRFYGFVMAICLRYSGSREAAEEILNDCFYKVFKYIHTYKFLVPFEFWIKKIAINASIDYYRKNANRSELTILDERYNYEEIEEMPELSLDDIMFLINKLSDNYRVTFMMHEIDGYKHKEIADQLGINETTSRSNLKRAKEKLKILYYQYFANNYERQIR